MIIGRETFRGRQQILMSRTQAVSGGPRTQRHRVGKLFHFGSGSAEVMIHGSVHHRFGYMYDEELETHFAARMEFVEVEWELRIKFFQLYTVRGLLKPATVDLS